MKDIKELAEQVQKLTPYGGKYLDLILEQFNAIEAKYRAIEKENKRLKSSLNKIRALTNSWVIAEQTIDCKHTYRDIEMEVIHTLQAEDDGESGS